MSWLSSARAAMQAVGASEAEIEACVALAKEERFDDEMVEMTWPSDVLEMVRELYAHSAKAAWAGIEMALYVKRQGDRRLKEAIALKSAEVRGLLSDEAWAGRSDEEIAQQCGVPHGGRCAHFVVAVRKGAYDE